MKKSVSLAKSAALMGVIILLSKALGLVRDILVASAYGTTMEAVAYGTASKLPTTVFDFVLGGVVTSAFIPVYNRIAVKKSKKDAMAFCQSYVNLILLITTTLAVLGVASINNLLYSALINFGFSLITNGVALRRIKKLKLSDLTA